MFYLGSPEPSWLALASTPLMVSRSRLVRRRAPLPPATAPWMLDSAAFTELDTHGRWTLDGPGWAKLARRWADEAGQLAAVAVQDWLCTPSSITSTGLTVEQHQRRTAWSYLELSELDADLPWLPTLQGWAPDDYMRHADLYAQLGVDLAAVPLVGVGSIAMRQETAVADRIVTAVHDELGLTNLHAFGAKESGLRRWGWALASADSMAWSFTARRDGRKATSCTAAHADCRNCLTWAEQWATTVAPLVGGAPPDHRQLALLT